MFESAVSSTCIEATGGAPIRLPKRCIPADADGQHDRGETAEARSLFKVAQLALPDSPSRCHLERPLIVQSDEAKARERVHLWGQSLQRRRDPELQALIALAEALAGEGVAASGELAVQQEPALAELDALRQAAPPSQLHYHPPHRGSDSAGPLEPSSALATIEAPMARAQQGGGDSELGPVLAQAPPLWHSFERIAALEGIAQPPADRRGRALRTAATEAC